ncbi:MAG: NAD(P)-dependent oxidoreductase, partial [Chloroflexota bacterium]
MRLGFVGLGAMGEPMSRNLLKAGHELTVYNRSAPARERAREAGAIVVETPREVAAAGEIVFSCIATPPAVEEVYLGPEGLKAGSRPGQLFVDLSSITPSLARKLSDQLKENGVSFIDAPVSGGTPGAQAGTLTIMVGADPPDLQRAEPVLRALGSKIYHVGPVGAGSTAKILNQLLVGVNTLAAMEMALLSQRSGVDLSTLEEIIDNSTGHSRVFESRFPKAMARDYSLGFAIDLMSKDLRLGMAMAEDLGVATPLASLALSVYESASALGFGRKDTTAAIEALEQRSTLKGSAEQA